MRLMAGLEKPTAGEVWASGKNVTGLTSGTAAQCGDGLSVLYQLSQFLRLRKHCLTT